MKRFHHYAYRIVKKHSPRKNREYIYYVEVLTRRWWWPWPRWHKYDYWFDEKRCREQIHALMQDRAKKNKKKQPDEIVELFI